MSVAGASASEGAPTVAIIGAGLSGMTAAALLQKRGLRTIVLEAHAIPGGCTGFYRRKGFAFDVGATTLVDFQPSGVGGQLLEELGFTIERETLPGYVAWLPDRTITLHREASLWHEERLKLGDSPAHHRFWATIDDLAHTFWAISRRGGRLPITSPADLARAIAAVRPGDLARMRYLRRTAHDLLAHHGLQHDRPLVALLSMIVEDTVHTTLERAPLVHAALGITMRGAGLARPVGGMRGFWESFLAGYERLGGRLQRACRVLHVRPSCDGYVLATTRGDITAHQVISTLPIEATCAIAPPTVKSSLQRFVERDKAARGGAIAVFLGVPEDEIADQTTSARFTHHQLLHDVDAPLGNGNNMFISVSSPGDTRSAPAGFRSVMITTHCELEPWEGLSPDAYAQRKAEAGQRLLSLARRVYPRLGENPRVCEVATPRTYERFTGRPRGAVGGVRLDPSRAGQRAVPQRLGRLGSPVPGFYLAGDTTWPGVGTVACVISGRAAADLACAHARRPRPAALRQRLPAAFPATER